MSLPLLFGREGEHTINEVPRKGYRGDTPSADDCIGLMQAKLMERFGAVPFGSIFGQMSSTDTLKLLCTGNSDEESGFMSRIGSGMFIPAIGRFYREVANPYFEVSTVLCSNPFDLYRLVRRGEKIIGHLARELSTKNYIIECHNSVSDRKGIYASSCGMHNNHFRSRELFEKVMRRQFRGIHHLHRPAQDLATFLVLSIIFRGEGKIGADCGTEQAFYQISARADFERFLIKDGTSTHRPIINTRDEPHADWSNYSRFHLINGEGNRSPWAFALGLGLESLFLAALDDEAIDLPWFFEYPVQTLHQISRDLLFKEKFPVIDRNTGVVVSIGALDMWTEILRQLNLYVARRNGLPEWCGNIIGEAQDLVEPLKRGDYRKARHMLDWAIKLEFMEEYAKRHLKLDLDLEESWKHIKIQGLDIGYHHIHDEWAWQVAKEYREVRDVDLYDSSDDDLSNFWSWAADAPKDNRNFLIWLLLRDPYLRNRVRIVDWAFIKLWEKDPEEAELFFLKDPHYFGRAHLTELLQGDFDFSTPAKRSRLKEILSKYAKASSRDRKRLTLEERRERDKFTPDNLAVQEREPEDLYLRSLGELEYVPGTIPNVDFPRRPPHTKRGVPKDRGEWL